MIYGNRAESFIYELLDNNDKVIGKLDTVHPGSTLDFSTSAEIRSSGSLTMTKSNDIDWLRSRIRISYVGETTKPLITALVRIPTEDHDDKTTLKIELKDKLAILANDTFGTSYVVGAGSNIVSTVINILWSAGQSAVSIEPSSQTTAGMVWDANTSKLRIINDLLAVANYFSIYVDGLGFYRSMPYVEPQKRPLMWTFEDTLGKGSYLPKWTRNYDPYSVPNKFICIGKGGSTEAAVGTAYDYDSPYGYNARGYWVPMVATDIEGTLSDIANRKLIESRNVYQTLDVQHLWLPFGINGQENRVNFVNKGIKYEAICQKQSWALGGLIKSNLRVIV